MNEKAICSYAWNTWSLWYSVRRGWISKTIDGLKNLVANFIIYANSIDWVSDIFLENNSLNLLERWNKESRYRYIPIILGLDDWNLVEVRFMLAPILINR